MLCIYLKRSWCTCLSYRHLHSHPVNRHYKKQLILCLLAFCSFMLQITQMWMGPYPSTQETSKILYIPCCFLLLQLICPLSIFHSRHLHSTDIRFGSSHIWIVLISYFIIFCVLELFCFVFVRLYIFFSSFVFISIMGMCKKCYKLLYRHSPVNQYLRLEVALLRVYISVHIF